MEYLVFLIYGIIVSQWISGGKSSEHTSYIPSGRSYYFSKAIINLIIGNCGMMLFNIFLRDKDIIPVWSFWVGFIGFALIIVSAVVYIIKMMMSNQP